jgi:hypothetical protein
MIYKGDTEEHRVVCPMKRTNCDFCKCEMKLKELEDHLEFLCEVKTEDCLCGKVVKAIDSKSHSEVCIKKDQIYLNRQSKYENSSTLNLPHIILPIAVSSASNVLQADNENSVSQNEISTQESDSCYICQKINIKHFDCIECNKNVCVNCEEIDRYGIHEYFIFLNEVMDFHIYNSFLLDYSPKNSCQKTSFFLLYILFGFLCDISIYAVLTLLFIFFLGFLQFFVIIPIHYVIWNVYLGRRRKCKICDDKQSEHSRYRF